MPWTDRQTSCLAPWRGIRLHGIVRVPFYSSPRKGDCLDKHLKPGSLWCHGSREGCRRGSVVTGSHRWPFGVQASKLHHRPWAAEQCWGMEEWGWREGWGLSVSVRGNGAAGVWPEQQPDLYSNSPPSFVYMTKGNTEWLYGEGRPRG